MAILAPTGSRNVLVVDDEPNILRLIEVSLKRIDCRVTCARNGIEALTYLANDHFDLIILDVVMPVLDGLTVLQKIRSDQSSEHIPVILLSAKQQDVDIFNGYVSGADIYLTKPFNPNELTTLVGH